jgi:hypothetical protein
MQRELVPFTCGEPAHGPPNGPPENGLAAAALGEERNGKRTGGVRGERERRRKKRMGEGKGRSGEGQGEGEGEVPLTTAYALRLRELMSLLAYKGTSL